MSNELVHSTAGTVLTQAEYEAISGAGGHVLNSQATGDLIYASSASQLSRLGIGATNTILTVIGGVPTWQSTLAGLTLTSPTINGIIATTGLTMPAFTLGGSLNVNNQEVIGIIRLRAYDSTHTYIENYPAKSWSFNTENAISASTTRLAFSGGVATAVATWSSITHSGLVLSASEKLYPVSGVAGFSVVSTALTLGSAGSIIAPVVAGANTDATSGNLDGAHGVDTTGAAERWYFRAGGAWRYISKTGGLSMTKEERIDPKGHEFKLGDEVKLIVDKIFPDGSFHAIPYYSKK